VTTLEIDRCFIDISGVAHYQLIQSHSGKFVLRFVPEGLGPNTKAVSDLSERISQVLESSTPIPIHATDMLAPESSGKFRLGYPAYNAAGE
jgi:hypothetical protein